MVSIEISGGLDGEGRELPARKHSGEGVFAFTLRRVREEGKTVGLVVNSVYRDTDGIDDDYIVKAVVMGLADLIQSIAEGNDSMEYELLRSAQGELSKHLTVLMEALGIKNKEN